MEERLPVLKKQKPKKRGSKKLLFFLFVFFISLLVVLFFQSSLSKITEVTVNGQQMVAKEQIKAAADVWPGDHFFSVSSDKIEAQVKALRMIEAVKVTKRFPGRIEIQVDEYDKVAYQFAEGGQLEALLADGSAVPVTMKGASLDMPILSGWPNDEPLKIQLCFAMAKLPSTAFHDISEIKPSPSGSYPDRIKMYTRSQFEVITTIGYLPEKMNYLKAYISNLVENKVTDGVITLLEADSHSPFGLVNIKK